MAGDLDRARADAAESPIWTRSLSISGEASSLAVASRNADKETDMFMVLWVLVRASALYVALAVLYFAMYS